MNIYSESGVNPGDVFVYDVGVVYVVMGVSDSTCGGDALVLDNYGNVEYVDVVDIVGYYDHMSFYKKLASLTLMPGDLIVYNSLRAMLDDIGDEYVIVALYYTDLGQRALVIMDGIIREVSVKMLAGDVKHGKCNVVKVHSV